MKTLQIENLERQIKDTERILYTIKNEGDKANYLIHLEILKERLSDLKK